MADQNFEGKATNDENSSRTQDNQGSQSAYGKMNVQSKLGTTTGTGMANDQTQGTVAGGTLPEAGLGAGNTTGGMATSNSTVSGGGSTGGTNPGGIATTDRGSTPIRDMTMQSDNLTARQSNSSVIGNTSSSPAPSQVDQVTTQDHHGATGHGRKSPGPLSQEEANRINQDARMSPGVTPPNDIGHERNS